LNTTRNSYIQAKAALRALHVFDGLMNALDDKPDTVLR
jgi:hypothetical protein